MMKKTHIFKLTLSTGMILGLSGCDTVKSTLGLNHYQADEWKVPNTPPLDLPPDYNLVPPCAGAKGPNAISPTALAQKKIGAPATADSSDTSGANLYSKISGSSEVDPSIRARVDQEAKSEGSPMEIIANMAKQAKDNLTGNGEGTRDTHKNPASTR